MAKGVPAALAALLLSGCAQLGLPDILGSGAAGEPAVLTESDMAAGVREALAVGANRAIGRIGVPDGFWLNRDLQIPLPESLRKADKALRALGQGHLVSEFHQSLNRAAEAAIPEAGPVIATAIRGMTLDDVRQIVHGPPTAATEYFQGKTAPFLTTRLKPLVSQATTRVGATRRYKELAERVGRYVPGYRMEDLDAYVTERALAGLFRTLAQEEMRIRNDPGARTTEALRRVFGAR